MPPPGQTREECVRFYPCDVCGQPVGPAPKGLKGDFLHVHCSKFYEEEGALQGREIETDLSSITVKQNKYA